MTYAPSTDELVYRENDGIGWLTFNRPKVRNALTFSMYDGVAELCSRDVDQLPQAIVITGAGDAFAAGTDIAQFLDFWTPEDAIAYEAHMSKVLDTLEDCPVPTIAAIRGACTGGGAAIASACDLRVGSPSALFGMPIARTLGNCLSIDTSSRIASLIGPSRLKELIFSARLVDANESKDMGWLHEVVNNEQELEVRVAELATTFTSRAPLTLRATKMALARIRRVSKLPDDDLIAMCYLSADFREGIDAFLAKRSPNWQGR